MVGHYQNKNPQEGVNHGRQRQTRALDHPKYSIISDKLWVKMYINPNLNVSLITRETFGKLDKWFES